jgi:hypothetical protein
VEKGLTYRLKRMCNYHGGGGVGGWWEREAVLLSKLSMVAGGWWPSVLSSSSVPRIGNVLLGLPIFRLVVAAL